jgi:monovalent cation:H+ antiporter, CPA1 family
MHIKLEDLSSQKWVITVLATAGVVASTFIVGGLTWVVLNFLKIPISFIPTTIHMVMFSMQPVSVFDEKDKPGGSSSVSMRQVQ